MALRQYAYDLVYADADARTAVTLDASHVGKVARQLDDDSYWQAYGTEIKTWRRLPDQEFEFDPGTGEVTHLLTGLKFNLRANGDEAFLDLPSALRLLVAGALRVQLSNRLYLWGPNDYGTGETETAIDLSGPDGSTTPGVVGDGIRLRFRLNTDDGAQRVFGDVIVEVANAAAAAPGGKAKVWLPNGAGGDSTLVFDGTERTLKIYNGVDLERTVESGWIDIPCRIEQAGGAAALTFEAYRDTEFDAYFMRHDQNDKLSLEWQMPHGWDLQAVRPHLHIEPQVNPASPQVIRFSGKYAWSRRGAATPADAAWTAFTVDHTVETTDAFIQRTVSLAVVAPPASPAPSDILMMWVKRLGLDAADTYTTSKASGTAQANLKISSIDAHVHVNKTGTLTEF